MNDYNLGFKTGLAFGCASNGVSATTLRKSASCVDVCLKAPEVQVQLAKIASFILHAAGPEFTKTASAYDVIIQRNGVESKVGREMFIEPVAHTLAGLEKSAVIADAATAPLKFATEAVAAPLKIANTGYEAIYKSALLSAIAGAGLGTIGWTLFRDVKEDDANAEAKLEQAKMYRRIAKDLQKRIDAQTDSAKANSKFRKDIENEGESDYVL